MIPLKDPSLLKTDAFINGEFVAAKGDKRFAVSNPAKGEIIAHVADFGAEGIQAAIEAAEAARHAWAARTAKERAGILRRWYELTIENGDDLAAIPDRRDGQASGRGQGRNPVWLKLY